jgi:hypothetical protein
LIEQPDCNSAQEQKSAPGGADLGKVKHADDLPHLVKPRTIAGTEVRYPEQENQFLQLSSLTFLGTWRMLLRCTLHLPVICNYSDGFQTGLWCESHTAQDCATKRNVECGLEK